MSKSNYEEADLLIRLYDLRRDSLLRKARAWFLSQFEAHSWEDKLRKYSPDSEEERYARMVISFWDMAAALVNRGHISEALFFETNREHYLIWDKIKPWIQGARKDFKNPMLYKNLEVLSINYEKWLDKLNHKTLSTQVKSSPKPAAKPVTPEPRSKAASAPKAKAASAPKAKAASAPKAKAASAPKAKAASAPKAKAGSAKSRGKVPPRKKR